MKTVVFYHKSCQDGFGSAWSARKALGDGPDVDYIPMQYGDPIPDRVKLAGVGSIPPIHHLYFLDFSAPRDVLFSLPVDNILVIDHHDTARASLGDLADPGRERDSIRAIFDMEKSGAVLTWEYFFPGKIVPKILQLVQDRDLWKWELPKSREVSAWLGSHERTFARWDYFADAIETEGRAFEDGVLEGEAILRAQASVVAMIADHAAIEMIDRYDVPTVNSSCYQSEIGEKLCRDYPDFPFSAVWYWSEEGDMVVSLRSRGGFDVSEVARKFGGGGHKAAAGFRIDRDDWNEMTNNE